jgi:hypothetical protein
MEGVRLDVNDDRCYQILLAGGEENMPLEIERVHKKKHRQCSLLDCVGGVCLF